MPYRSILLKRVTGLVKNLAPFQWDRFASWLLSTDSPMANVDPLPSCLVIVKQLYQDRLAGRKHVAATWKDRCDCLFGVCLGQRWSESCDQRSRRRRMSGRLAASAGANAAFVYAAFPYNPQRYFSPPRLIIHKVHAIADACAAHSWTVARADWKHRRDEAAQNALKDCIFELKQVSVHETLHAPRTNGHPGAAGRPDG